MRVLGYILLDYFVRRTNSSYHLFYHFIWLHIINKLRFPIRIAAVLPAFRASRAPTPLPPVSLTANPSRTIRRGRGRSGQSSLCPAKPSAKLINSANLHSQAIPLPYPAVLAAAAFIGLVDRLQLLRLGRQQGPNGVEDGFPLLSIEACSGLGGRVRGRPRCLGAAAQSWLAHLGSARGRSPPATRDPWTQIRQSYNRYLIGLIAAGAAPSFFDTTIAAPCDVGVVHQKWHGLLMPCATQRLLGSPRP